MVHRALPNKVVPREDDPFVLVDGEGFLCWDETCSGGMSTSIELYLRMFETILTPERTAEEVAGVMIHAGA